MGGISEHAIRTDDEGSTIRAADGSRGSGAHLRRKYQNLAKSANVPPRKLHARSHPKQLAVREQYTTMPPQGLQFITFADPDHKRDDQTMSRIRQHAMRDVGISRRLPNSRRSRRRKLEADSEVPLETAELHELPLHEPPVLTPKDASAINRNITYAPDGSANDSPALEPGALPPRVDRFASPLQHSIPRPPSYEIDPFQSMPMATDSTVYTLIKYYKYHYHENGNWVYETGSLPHEPHLFRQYVEEKARLAFNDRLTMYCLLAATAARMRNRDNVRCVHIQKNMRLYMCRALQLLRQRIEHVHLETTESTTQMMHCIAFVASAESYYDNFQAARAHRSAIAALVDLLGGISAVDNEYTRGQIIAFDVLLSCQILQPSVIECQYDPGPISADAALQAWKLSVRTHDSPWGLGLLISDDRLVDSSLGDTIHNLVEIQNVRERLKVMPDHPLSNQARRWACHRTAAVRVALLASEPACTAARALRIVLIMYTLLPEHDLTRAWVVKLQSRMLRQELENSPPRDWSGRHDVKLWVLLMGYFCARDDAEEKHWFLHLSSMRGSSSADLAATSLRRQ